MKILFLTSNEKGLFSNLVDWINKHTEHKASLWNKLKSNPEGKVLTSPMTDPDVIVCVDNFIEFENEKLMGITSRPKRALYLTGSPRIRGGMNSYTPRFAYHSDIILGQCEMDQELYLVSQFNPITMQTEQKKLFPRIVWLPLPVDVNLRKATIPTDELKMSHTQNFMATAGAYDTGFGFLRKLAGEVGFKLDVIRGVSREEALLRKAHSNLVYDNPRGNIGVTGLESLAQGIPVVGWFSPLVLAQYERLGKDFPAMTYVDDNDLIKKLQAFKNKPSDLVVLGEKSREWMQKNYSPEKVAKYWVTTMAKELNLS